MIQLKSSWLDSPYVWLSHLDADQNGPLLLCEDHTNWGTGIAALPVRNLCLCFPIICPKTIEGHSYKESMTIHSPGGRPSIFHHHHNSSDTDDPCRVWLPLYCPTRPSSVETELVERNPRRFGRVWACT